MCETPLSCTEKRRRSVVVDKCECSAANPLRTIMADWVAEGARAPPRPAGKCGSKLKYIIKLALIIRVIAMCAGGGVTVASFFGFSTATALVNKGGGTVRPQIMLIVIHRMLVKRMIGILRAAGGGKHVIS